MKTLRAKISCYGSVGVWKLVSPQLISLAPKEVRDPLDAKQSEMMRFHVTPVYEIEPSNIDSYYLAPHLILYFFDSKSQSEFKKTQLPQIEQFKQKYNRDYINIQYVFVNDPKKTGTKSFFGDGANYIPYLQLQLNNLSVFNVKSKGEIKKKDITKCWGEYVTLIKQSILQRIEHLKKLTQNITNLTDFRNALTYVAIYDDLGYYLNSLEVLNNTKRQVKQNASVLSPEFMTKVSFTFSLDLSTGADDAEETLANATDSIPIFNLLFIISKRITSSYFSLERPWNAIEQVWNFLTENVDEISATKVYEPEMINLWIASVLNIIITYCQNEISVGRTQTFKFYTAALEWYLRLLPSISEAMVKYPSPNNAKFGKTVLESLSGGKDLKSEMNKLNERLCLVYINSGYSRCAALAAQQERTFTSSTTKERTFLHQMIRPLVKGPRPKILQCPTVESYSTLKPQDLLNAAALHMLDDGEDSEIAVQVLNKFLSVKQTEQCNYRMQLPIVVDVTQKHHAVQGVAGKFKMKFQCPFKAKLHIPAMSLNFRGERNNGTVICANDFDLYDGVVVDFEGCFENAGFYKLVSGDLHIGVAALQISMVNTNYFIVVDEQVPSFTVSVELPEYLLPNWQYALIKLTCSHKQTLTMKVNGIKYKPGVMKLENNNDLKAKVNDKNEMIFEDVPEGQHELFLLVFAQSVGTLTLTVSSKYLIQTVEQPFQVSEFLNVKVEYLKSTGVAMVSGTTDMERGIAIQSVQFLDANGNALETDSIGIPAPLSPLKRSALIEINGDPETAVLTLSQEGLKPFTLRFNIINIDEVIQEPEVPKIVAPMTCLIPDGVNPFVV